MFHIFTKVFKLILKTGNGINQTGASFCFKYGVVRLIQLVSPSLALLALLFITFVTLIFTTPAYFLKTFKY